MLALFFHLVVVGQGIHLAIGVELVSLVHDQGRVLLHLNLSRLQLRVSLGLQTNSIHTNYTTSILQHKTRP